MIQAPSGAFFLWVAMWVVAKKYPILREIMFPFAKTQENPQALDL